jgi:hypothetical protein
MHTPPVTDPSPRIVVSATLWPLYSRERDKAPSVQDSGWASRPIETRITCLQNQVASNEPSVDTAVDNRLWAQSDQTEI